MAPAPITCLEQACPDTAVTAGRCRRHHLARRRQTDRRRPTAAQRGYGARWRAVADEYLREHPRCECGCGKRSTDVHHLDGRGPRGPRGLDPTNLQALAHDCHSRITAQLQPGGFSRGRDSRLTEGETHEFFDALMRGNRADFIR